MSVKPTIALRALLVGGIAAFVKIAGAAKAAGGVKLGAAAATNRKKKSNHTSNKKSIQNIHYNTYRISPKRLHIKFSHSLPHCA